MNDFEWAAIAVETVFPSVVWSVRPAPTALGQAQFRADIHFRPERDERAVAFARTKAEALRKALATALAQVAVR